MRSLLMSALLVAGTCTATASAESEKERPGLVVVDWDIPMKISANGSEVATTSKAKPGALLSFEASPGSWEIVGTSLDGLHRVTEQILVESEKLSVVGLRLKPALRDSPGTEPPEALPVDTRRVTPPVLIQKVHPEYPDAERRAKHEGTCVLRCVIDLDGDVTVVGLVESAAALDIPAISAVTQWRYKPATLEGNPVDVYLTTRVSFSLDTNAKARSGKHRK